MIVAGQLLATAGCGRSAESREANEPRVDVAAKAAPESTALAAPGVGETARKEAAENDKYLFAFFQKADDAETASMRSVFEKTLPKIGDRADSVVVDITNPSNRPPA